MWLIRLKSEVEFLECMQVTICGSKFLMEITSIAHYLLHFHCGTQVIMTNKTLMILLILEDGQPPLQSNIPAQLNIVDITLMQTITLDN